MEGDGRGGTGREGREGGGEAPHDREMLNARVMDGGWRMQLPASASCCRGRWGFAAMQQQGGVPGQGCQQGQSQERQSAVPCGG